MISPEAFALLISAIFGGGLVAALVAYRKAGPEVEALSVSTLKGVIEELRSELERKDKQIKEQNITIGNLQSRVEALEAKLA